MDPEHFTVTVLIVGVKGGGVVCTITVEVQCFYSQVEWAETFTRLETRLLLNLSRCLRRLGSFLEAEKFAAQVLRTM